ncbi:ATP-binding protein [Dyadobacter diqingensis]|uniref:ATP-binding protein n=1 Tax=Dyadobacter diqingensis TaxID=2938121 RepID=UPI0020C1A6A1|nr:ATP-binding protein [Dyadobacter diqingensis]
MTRHLVSYLASFLLLLNLAFTYEPCFADHSSFSAQAVKGVINLKSADLDQSSVALDGEWKFYWKTLKKPHTPEIYSEFVSLPKPWRETKWRGKQLPSQGFATYEVKVILPHKRDQLAFKIRDMYSAYALYVNGKLIAKDGKPGTTKEETTPYWSTQIKPFPSSDTLNLTLHIANFRHSKGGITKSIEIGSFSELQAKSNLDHALDFLLTGCMIMGGLYFLGLYLLGRHDKSTLYFSLFCFFYSYRIIGTGDYAFHALFPAVSWQLAIHCEYISLFLAVAMFALYTRNLFPEDTPHKIIFCMTGICFALTLITLVSPPLLFTELINPFIALLVLYILFAIYIYWKAYRNKRIGAKYALLSTVAIFIIFLSLIFAYYNIAYPEKLSLFLGYICFFFCQSVILSFRFAYTLKKAKADAETGLMVKNQFLSTMSHEIKTPLNAVIGMSHIMIKESPRPDQKQHLDMLLYSANNLLTIVNDILDLNAIEEGKIQFVNESLNVSEIARNIISGYTNTARDAGIDVILKLDQDLPYRVTGDSKRLSQIITNLVSNAIKFTGKGWVKLEVSITERTAQDVSLKISVQDTGIGIAPEKQKIIFDQFTQIESSSTRGFGGTGVGLAISKRLLELQGSALQLKSEEGIGSDFYFTQTFKILEAIKKQEAVVNENPEEKPLQGIRILVVEDNRMNVLVVQGFLRRWGAVSDVAVNGQEALDKFDPLLHQIILMDLHMPVMDGYEATRQLRERGETVPVIAVTASLAPDAKQDMFNIGMTDIVSKPINPEQLLSKILNQTIRS